jgi:ribokinase
MSLPVDRLPAEDLAVVCLPDLFLDHVIELPEIDEAEETIRRIHSQGGGKVLDVPQQVIPGGNAANAAHALARLGLEVDLAGRTSQRGKAFFQCTIARDGVGLSLVREDGELAATSVLAYGAEGTNVMLNDPGSVEGYGPEDLREADEQAIRAADAVLVGNWASMTEHGTELVRHVVDVADGADTWTYLDAADPSRREDRDELVAALADVPLDVWAMNDAEVELFSGEAGLEAGAQALAERTGARVDVHSGETAVSARSGVVAEAETFDVEPRHLTGAGDAFNAGNLVGDLLGLDPGERLRLAHAVAAATISHPDARPPDAEALAALETQAQDPTARPT